MKLLNELYTVNLLKPAEGANVRRYGKHVSSEVNQLSAGTERIRRSNCTKTGTTARRRQPLLLGLVVKDSLFRRSFQGFFFFRCLKAADP